MSIQNALEKYPESPVAQEVKLFLDREMDKQPKL